MTTLKPRPTYALPLSIGVVQLPPGVHKHVGASVSECEPLLRSHEVDGILMDGPILSYWKSRTQWVLQDPDIHHIPVIQAPPLALIFAEGSGCSQSSVYSQLNVAIRQIVVSPTYEAMHTAWFGDTNSEFEAGDVCSPRTR